MNNRRNGRAGNVRTSTLQALVIVLSFGMIIMAVVAIAGGMAPDDRPVLAPELRGVGVKSLTAELVSAGGAVYPVMSCDSSAAEGQPGLVCEQDGFVNPMAPGKYHLRVTIGLWEHEADKGLKVIRLLPVTINIASGQ